MLFRKEILSENGPDPARSQENGQADQQMHKHYSRIFHGQAACAALNSRAREPDRCLWAAQLRIRHAQIQFRPRHLIKHRKIRADACQSRPNLMRSSSAKRNPASVTGAKPVTSVLQTERTPGAECRGILSSVVHAHSFASAAPIVWPANKAPPECKNWQFATRTPNGFLSDWSAPA